MWVAIQVNGQYGWHEENFLEDTAIRWRKLNTRFMEQPDGSKGRASTVSVTFLDGKTFTMMADDAREKLGLPVKADQEEES